MLFIVVVVTIATLWLSTKHERIISFFKTNQIDIDLAELYKVKNRLLQYAVLQPEIYLTDAGGALQESAVVPSPGYFPCPDLTGDGIAEGSCTNPLNLSAVNPDATGFLPDLSADLTALGYVPEKISTRQIYFGESRKFYYFLDERFSYNNGNYPNDTNETLNRYAPLYPGSLIGDVASATASTDPFMPVLTLDGVTGYIALIIDPGADGQLDPVNRDGDRDFVSIFSNLSDEPNADKIVGIDYTEWLSLMVHRVCVERVRIQGINFDGDSSQEAAITDLEDIGSATGHWFNDYNAATNENGGNWREWGVVCP